MVQLLCFSSAYLAGVDLLDNFNMLLLDMPS
jgi:hypothetical protein